MTARPDLVLPLAGLLAESPGSTRRMVVRGVTIPMDDELILATPIDGDFEVVRTNRGLLVDGTLKTVLEMECSRCLAPTQVALATRVAEEVLPSVDVATGQVLDQSSEPDITRLNGHHELDFEPLLREAILLSAPIAPLCRPDCLGLCIECGERLGDGHQSHADEDIDPRLAALRTFRVDGDAKNE